MSVTFREVLENRRTHRHFEDRQVGLDAFSDLLHYGFAPLRFSDSGEMGMLQLRASASGGARHETEAFVFVFNVASVRPGLYHYDNIRHGLEPIRDDVDRGTLEHLTFKQGFFTNASFGILTAATAYRMSWKYPHPVAYRMLLQNIGHVAQVFSMTATAMGLGASLTGAIRTTEGERVLRLRRPGEFITFALACGHPVLRRDGMPTGITTPDTASEHY
jgi:SagB-type dehydrogenase family enzyme